jgi:hypothetical protein
MQCTVSQEGHVPGEMAHSANSPATSPAPTPPPDPTHCAFCHLSWLPHPFCSPIGVRLRICHLSWPVPPVLSRMFALPMSPFHTLNSHISPPLFLQVQFVCQTPRSPFPSSSVLPSTLLHLYSRPFSPVTCSCATHKLPALSFELSNMHQETHTVWTLRKVWCSYYLHLNWLAFHSFVLWMSGALSALPLLPPLTFTDRFCFVFVRCTICSSVTPTPYVY